MKLQVLISEVQRFCPLERCDSLGLVWGFFCLLAFIVVGLVLVLLLVFKGF